MDYAALNFEFFRAVLRTFAFQMLTKFNHRYHNKQNLMLIRSPLIIKFKKQLRKYLIIICVNEIYFQVRVRMLHFLNKVRVIHRFPSPVHTKPKILPEFWPSRSQWCRRPPPRGWWFSRWGSWQRFACLPSAWGPGGGWIPSGCCSQRESCHPPAACRRRSASAGPEGCPPYPLMKKKSVKEASIRGQVLFRRRPNSWICSNCNFSILPVNGVIPVPPQIRYIISTVQQSARSKNELGENIPVPRWNSWTSN